MNEDSSRARGIMESDDEDGSDTETLTCPRGERVNHSAQNLGQAEEQSIADLVVFEDDELDNSADIAAVTETMAALLKDLQEDEIDTASFYPTEVRQEPGVKKDGSGEPEKHAESGNESEESVPDEFKTLVEECCAIRESVGNRSNAIVNGTVLDDPIPVGIETRIGGDTQHIYMAAAQVAATEDAEGKLETKATLNETLPVEKAQAGAVSSKDAVTRPTSGGVGVALGSGSGEKKKKPTRLPLPVTPTHSQGTGGPHQVKKLPALSPLGNSSPLSTSASTAPLNKPRSATASPYKHSLPARSPSGPTPNSAERKRATPTRAQTARPARPLESPLAQSASNLHLDLNKRSSSDFSRLFKPTASISAKYSGGRASSARASPSPSKSLGDTSIRTSTSAFMMGDAGGDVAGGSSPAAAAVVASGAGEPAEGSGGIKEQFTAFSKFGDATSDGKQITLSNSDKWMKQAHVVDGKKITTTDTSITFKKLFKTAKKVGFEDFKRYVEDLSKSKGMEGKDVLDKLAHCGAPGLSQATKAAHAGVVSRLTDTSKYTGSHKERFDSSGKGRGIEGRREVQDNSGYVAAFKEKKESQSSPTAK